MSTNQQQTEKKQYEKYVKKMTPSHNLYVNMIRAFFTVQPQVSAPTKSLPGSGVH